MQLMVLSQSCANENSAEIICFSTKTLGNFWTTVFSQCKSKQFPKFCEISPNSRYHKIGKINPDRRSLIRVEVAGYV
jgi:hypothetical protein